MPAAQPKPEEQMPSSATGVLIAVFAIVGVTLLLYGLPGMAVIWLGVLLGSLVRPTPILTGKGPGGQAMPIDEQEASLQAKYLSWQRLRAGLLALWNLARCGWPEKIEPNPLLARVMPGPQWLTKAVATAAAWPVQFILSIRLPWLAAIAVGAAAAGMPQMTGWLRLVNGVLAAVLVIAVTDALRARYPYGERAPVTRIGSTMPTRAAIIGGAIGLAVGAGATWWFAGHRPVDLQVAVLPFLADDLVLADAAQPRWWTAAGLVLAPGLLLYGKIISAKAQAHWRMVMQARSEYRLIWPELKITPEPQLLDRVEFGDSGVHLDSFRATQGAAQFLVMTEKLAPHLGGTGGTVRIALLERPGRDGNGQPVTGSMHSNEFQIAVWPMGSEPDLTAATDDLGEPGNSERNELVTLFLRSATAWALGGGGWTGRLINTMAVPISSPESPSGAWATRWVPNPAEMSMRAIRQDLSGAISGAAGCEVLIDEKGGAIFFGALTGGSTEFTDESGVTTKTMTDLDTWDTWDGRWGATGNAKINAPLPQFEVYRSGKVGRVELHCQPFVILNGQRVSDFLGTPIEDSLKTTLAGAPLVSVQFFPGQDGSRHSQAISVVWSHDHLPMQPQKIVPPTSKAPASPTGSPHQWALTAAMTHAFRGARLAQPDVVSARPLTTVHSDGHIWDVVLRFSGGVTLRDVRSAQAKIQSALQTHWLRIDSHAQGCRIVAGADPSQVDFVDSEAEDLCLNLNFDQAFADAALMSKSGEIPQQTGESRLDENPDVMRKSYIVPGTVTLEKIKEKISILQSSTNLGYLVALPGTEANEVVLECARTDPMETDVPFDASLIDGKADQYNLPLGKAINGTMLRFNRSLGPHLAILGVSGGGKSVAGSALIGAALVSGAKVVMIDPEKQAADYTWAKPWMVGWADTYEDAGPLSEAVVAEMDRRIAAYLPYGADIYAMPENERPPEMYVFIDEASELLLMPKQPPSKPLNSPKAEQARLHELALYDQKSSVRLSLQKSAAKARAAGIHLVVMGQSLRADVLDGLGNFKNQLARIMLGKASFGDLQSALREPTKAPDLGENVPPGRGVFEPVGAQTGLIQFWWAKQEVLAAAITETGRQPTPEDEWFDLEAYRDQVQHEEFSEADASEWKFDDDDDDSLDMGEMDVDLDDLIGEVDGSADSDDEPESLDGDQPDEEPAMPVDNSPVPAVVEEDGEDDAVNEIEGNAETDEKSNDDSEATIVAEDGDDATDDSDGGDDDFSWLDSVDPGTLDAGALHERLGLAEEATEDRVEPVAPPKSDGADEDAFDAFG